MPNKQITIESRRRLQNVLWGLFIGDALAMPASTVLATARLKSEAPNGKRPMGILFPD